MFLVVFEIAVAGFILYVIISQIVVPISKGTKLFPSLRTTGKIKEQIIDAKTSLSDEELLDHLDKMKTEILEKKNRRVK